MDRVSTYLLPATGASDLVARRTETLWGRRHFWGEFTALPGGDALPVRPPTFRPRLRTARVLVPALADLLDRFGVSLQDLQVQLSNAALGVSQFLATNLVAFGQDALRGTALFFLMLYLLFFFLRDGAQLLEQVIGALPIGDARERRLFHKFAEVSRATIKGTIVIGLVQGLLGGLIFWILGIEAAALWGVVMAVLSLLPAVGAALVWVPAAALLIATGRVGEGLLLLVFGTVIISLADNVLRPILVGRDTQMPDYVVLVTTLGGLALFGLSGVVIGPIIGALFLTVWEMFGQEYAHIASDGDRPPAREAED